MKSKEGVAVFMLSQSGRELLAGSYLSPDSQQASPDPDGNYSEFIQALDDIVAQAAQSGPDLAA
jgi:hypothetical protein